MVSGQPNEFKTKTTATKIESNRIKTKKFNYESKTVKVREHKERNSNSKQIWYDKPTKRVDIDR